jgi:hypothetical protein
VAEYDEALVKKQGEAEATKAKIMTQLSGLSCEPSEISKTLAKPGPHEAFRQTVSWLSAYLKQIKDMVNARDGVAKVIEMDQSKLADIEAQMDKMNG